MKKVKMTASGRHILPIITLALTATAPAAITISHNSTSQNTVREYTAAMVS